jgi:hypothetical protein
LFLAVLAVLVLAGACSAPVEPTTVLEGRAMRPVTHQDRSGWTLLPSPEFDGRLRLIDVEAPAQGTAGSSVRVSSTWLVTGELAGRPKPQVVVEIAGAVGQGGFATGFTSLQWRPGDVVVSVVDVPIPAATPAGAARVLVGMSDAGRRWLVDVAATDHLVDVAAVGMVAAPVVARGPQWQAHKRQQPITIDGRLDERDWANAAVVTLGPYKVGTPEPQHKTQVRLLWDEAALYVAFDVDDDDPFSPYTNHDDPLYDSEALEVFIDADGDRDIYVELQASPTDVRFDAAFAGGPRKNMDRAFNADVVVKSAKRPGGYVQEWRIGTASLRDIPIGEPAVGARWRINVFRLERRRAGDVVVSTEASAWSAIAANDFHALDRMGSLVFIE